MPLTNAQNEIALLLSQNRSPDSYLAGGAAMNLTPNTKRYSQDLDYFHDSEERVAQAFSDDSKLLESNGYSITVEIQQPGYIRGIAQKENAQTKIEWAHDSAWRFLPVIKSEVCGYQLHPIDLALNKVLCLAGRDEPRDFIDVLGAISELLPLGALCWAAAGKDPGFSPLSLLSLLRRRSKYQSEDFKRLHLAQTVSLVDLKQQWLGALDDAQKFIGRRPPEEVGCLYFSKSSQQFVQPDDPADLNDIVPHYGQPGGVLPLVK